MKLPNNIKDCHALIKVLVEQVMVLSKEVNVLSEDVQRLKEQVNQNSKNSSKPPSSDGYRKKAILAKQKKKTGGQRGHKGDTLKMVEQPDKVEILCPQVCPCGANLSKVPKSLHQSRQVFDLPQPQLVVTEYQSMTCDCPHCGSTVYQPFPEEVKAPVQYGTGVKALVTLLNNKYHLSWQRTSELCEDLFGHYINDNTQQSILNLAYDKLEIVEEDIKQAILESQVAHADETGFRVAGKLHWLHGLSTDELTYIFCHEKRGGKAITSSASILPDYTNTLVHDCWASYFKLDQCSHSLCGAHLLRELEGRKESGADWARKMQALLLYLHDKVPKGYRLDHEDVLWRHYDRICQLADEYEPHPQKKKRKGRTKKSKGRNLLNRLVKYKKEVLRFAMQQDIPFTNNQAERDVRPAKVKQKNAGCFRTKVGADRWCRIYSFLSTIRKQNRNVFEELSSILGGVAFNL